MGNDREIDDETAALLTYLATPDGMEILKSGLSAVVSGVLIIGACFLWWPESEIAKGVVQIVGALTVFGLLSAVRGAWILYRDGMSVPPPELAWMTHNLAPEDPRAKIIAGHLAREAEKRAARRARPFWRRAIDGVVWVWRLIGAALRTLILLALMGLIAVAAIWASYWIFARSTGDYGLLAGILVACPFWLVTWSLAAVLWKAILSD